MGRALGLSLGGESMTPQDILSRLFTDKGVTPERIQKAQGLALRHQIDWPRVLSAMTDDQRKAVESNG